MPRPAQAGQRYVAGLDGIRALAVVCVITYHLGVPWAQGGMLGVGVFFTLSGYLITDLLLSHWHRHGDLGLAQFWLRRARRLLPALFLMLAVVSVWVALLDVSQLAEVRKQVFAAALYLSNWWTIAQHGSYFSNFAAPLPLDHLWSLAIEEQFYLVWPWLLFLGIWTVRTRAGLAIVALIAAAASAFAMSALYHPGYDPTRVYEGTDTRALGLLIGIALAMVWPSDRRQRVPPAVVRNALDGIGVAGLVAIFVLVWRTTPFTPFLYPYGFLVLSAATAAVVAAAVTPGTRLGSALGWGPLLWVGVRSYGIYLWQWPIIVLTSPAQSGFDWSRAVPQVAATVLVAAVSWRYVEDPIRHGALGRLWRQARSGAGRLRVRPAALAASGAALGAVFLPVASLTGALPTASVGLGSASGAADLQRLPPPTRADLTSARLAAPETRTRARTSCRSAVYIGDSTSEGEIERDYVPDRSRRLNQQLADVGVRWTWDEISGARSIVETYKRYPNAATVAHHHVATGFHGCWILALGTNDVDNVHDGGIGFAPRIKRMMSIIGHRPVMWVNVISLRSPPDPYSEPAMQHWNRALMAACPRYPNMRVYDWGAHARRHWFTTDGIHYTSLGYEERSHLIAHALAKAFPEHGPPSPTCLVR